MINRIIFLFLLFPSLVFADAALIGEESLTPSSSAGIAFDAASSGSNILGEATLTFSHTTGTGSNRALIVVAGGNTIDEGDITGVTYNAVAMTREWDKSGAATYNSSGWSLVNPASGANDVVITLSGAVSVILGVSSSFTGIHQTTPTGAETTGAASNDTPTVDVPAVVDDWVVDGVFSASGDCTVDASQTQRSVVTASSRRLAMSTEVATTTTATMSWTHTSGWWATGGMALKAAD